MVEPAAVYVEWDPIQGRQPSNGKFLELRGRRYRRGQCGWWLNLLVKMAVPAHRLLYELLMIVLADRLARRLKYIKLWRKAVIFYDNQWLVFWGQAILLRIAEQHHRCDLIRQPLFALE